MIVLSDKTPNFYTMNVKEYQQHLDKEVMKDYKKVDIKKAMDIDSVSLVSVANEFREIRT